MRAARSPSAATGFVLLSRMGAGASIPVAVRNVILVGAGMGLMIQTLVIVAQNAVPHQLVGAVTAMGELSRLSGALIGVAVLGAVISARVLHGVRDAPSGPLVSAFHIAFLLPLGVVALTFVAVLALPNVVLDERRTSR